MDSLAESSSLFSPEALSRSVRPMGCTEQMPVRCKVKMRQDKVHSWQAPKMPHQILSSLTVVNKFYTILLHFFFFGEKIWSSNLVERLPITFFTCHWTYAKFHSSVFNQTPKIYINKQPTHSHTQHPPKNSSHLICTIYLTCSWLCSRGNEQTH